MVSHSGFSVAGVVHFDPSTGKGKMPLNFHGAEPFLSPMEQTICWNGDDGRRKVPCKVTGSALDALYGTTELAEEDRWIIFNRHRGIFEAIAYRKFDAHQITEGGAVVVEAADVADYHGKFGEYRRPARGNFS